MHDVGITEDRGRHDHRGRLLEFARCTLVADLPASRVPLINTLLERAAERSSRRRVSRRRTPTGSTSSRLGRLREGNDGAQAAGGGALRELGFDLDEETFDEVFVEIDGDGDSITNEEFINGIGMLKREVLEIMRSGVVQLRANARRSATGGDIEAATRGPPKDEHMIYASDLVAILGVTELEAEEMILSPT